MLRTLQVSVGLTSKSTGPVGALSSALLSSLLLPGRPSLMDSPQRLLNEANATRLSACICWSPFLSSFLLSDSSTWFFPWGPNSVSLSQRTFSNSHCPNTQPPYQPLQLQLSCYNCYAPQHASHAESAPLRTWCYCENVQVCAHAHDDFQGELTSQNLQPKKCTDIGVHHSLFKILVVFHDFLNQISIS